MQRLALRAALKADASTEPLGADTAARGGGASRVGREKELKETQRESFALPAGGDGPWRRAAGLTRGPESLKSLSAEEGEIIPSKRLAAALLRVLREVDLEAAQQEEVRVRSAAQRRRRLHQRELQAATARTAAAAAARSEEDSSRASSSDLVQKTERRGQAFKGSAHEEAFSSSSRGGTENSLAGVGGAEAGVLNKSAFCYLPSEGCYTTTPLYASLLDCLVAEAQARQSASGKRSALAATKTASSHKHFLSLEREAEAFVASSLLRRQLELRKTQGQQQGTAAAASPALEAAPKWLADVSRHLLPYVAQVTSRAFFDPVYRQQLLLQQQKQP